MNNIEKEKNKNFSNENGISRIINPITFSKVERYSQKKNAICQITTKNVGTGFFCLLNIDNQLLRVLFSNNHVLGNDEIKIGSKIKILHEEKIKYIEITKDIFTSTNEYLDYTCIEILNDELFQNYFEIDSKINCEDPYKEYKLDEFVIIQCPKGEISFGEGKIEKIKDEFIFYSIPTEKGSSGSPLIVSTRNLNIIGIHCQGSDNLNKGVYFKYVLEDIKDNIKRKNFKIKEFNQGKIFKQINENNEKILSKGKNCLIKIIIEDINGNKIGIENGFFCKLLVNKNHLNVLITNNKVINREFLENKRELIIEHLNEKKIINLNNDRFKFTNEEIDFTVIEILSQDLIEDFFEIDEFMTINDCLNKEIFIINYPQGEDISLIKGKIINIKIIIMKLNILL